MSEQKDLVQKILNDYPTWWAEEKIPEITRQIELLTTEGLEMSEEDQRECMTSWFYEIRLMQAEKCKDNKLLLLQLDYEMSLSSNFSCSREESSVRNVTKAVAIKILENPSLELTQEQEANLCKYSSLIFKKGCFEYNLVKLAKYENTLKVMLDKNLERLNHDNDYQIKDFINTIFENPLAEKLWSEDLEDKFLDVKLHYEPNIRRIFIEKAAREKVLLELIRVSGIEEINKIFSNPHIGEIELDKLTSLYNQFASEPYRHSKLQTLRKNILQRELTGKIEEEQLELLLQIM